jgi:pimeloyl-ACP methyl ester carboxylesterase
MQQNDISQNWLATNWTGVCDELTKVSSPTLIITGTQCGAWLVQIKDAGHALFVQYPDRVNRVLQTFLSATTNRG